jgi:hypothetical protein
MIDAPVDKRIAARGTLSNPNEFVRRGDQASMEKTVVSGRNRPPEIDLTWWSR